MVEPEAFACISQTPREEDTTDRLGLTGRCRIYDAIDSGGVGLVTMGCARTAAGSVLSSVPSPLRVISESVTPPVDSCFCRNALFEISDAVISQASNCFDGYRRLPGLSVKMEKTTVVSQSPMFNSLGLIGCHYRAIYP
jgi:hypothetical protein